MVNIKFTNSTSLNLNGKLKLGLSNYAENIVTDFMSKTRMLICSCSKYLDHLHLQNEYLW